MHQLFKVQIKKIALNIKMILNKIKNIEWGWLTLAEEEEQRENPN